MKNLLRFFANFIDEFKNTNRISFIVREELVTELENQEPIPWQRVDILIDDKNLIEILKDYEKFEASHKSNDINLAGMYDGLEPQSIKNNLNKTSDIISIYQCSECYSSTCGAHLKCKIKRGLIFTTLSDFEQKPYTSNNCCHVETRVKAFWDYSKFMPLRVYTWQIDRALKEL